MSQMSIESFDDLLLLARQQPDPQRLLFVFTQPELPEGHTAEQAERFAAGAGGHLAPVVCVDKTPEELSSFAALVEESQQAAQDWVVMFVAALSGQAGVGPGEEQVEQSLRYMVEGLRTGRVASFLAFDRQGSLLQLSNG